MNVLTNPTIPTTPASPALLQALRDLLGDKGLLTDPSDMKSYLSDWRGTLTGSAAAVARPASTEEVAGLVRLCAAEGVAIVPQRGNTGLMGGATPYGNHTGIVVSLGRMNRAIEVDPLGSTMTVEAGCVLQALQELAAANDKLLPLSLGAQGSCMIGGNLSTNAGGAQVLHYGNTRSFVLGLEVVLPSGEVWNGLKALKKDNTGYDIKHLFIGAEGTLGIITKAVIKVWPKPKDIATAWINIRDPQAAVELLSEAHIASEDAVTSCELMNRTNLNGVFHNIPGVVDPLPGGDSQFYLLMEWSSSLPKDGVMLARMEEFLADAMERGLVLDAVLAQNSQQAKAMWHIRESHAEAGRYGAPAVSYDISVASSAIPRFIVDATAAAKAVLPEIRSCPMGHMGDGNLHFNFKAPEGMSRETFQQYKAAVTRAVNDTLVPYGGSISAEHGIGSEKIGELAHYADPVKMATMRAIKRALDPQNIMNPGKIFLVS
ncbi:MAG: FAD-binding oxidoreductase [Alphaproteobacteria bacterium]|nr:FAD-binding oxidoreductase [Alphaproteobacteria bacterium]